MSLSVGIVGLPNSGKSTLFNALITKPKAGVGKYPFTTIEKNIGVVNVPDDTLFDIAKIENITKVTPATVTFVDIAGLIKGAHEGEGLGNEFLHHIREVDLILHVVRFFKSEDIPHVHSKIDPQDDVVIINDELIFADLDLIDRRLKREKVTSEEKEVLQKVSEKLNQGVLAKDIPLSEQELEFVKPLNFLTMKKQLLVANIGEDSLENPPKEINGQSVIAICAKLESELSELPWTEERQFIKEYGLKQLVKETIIVASYKSLDLVTFYTIAKRNEARAWPIERGDSALSASGHIHTDFEKHFIKAEVIRANELLVIGSWNKAREQGKIRLEGRDYVVQDGDVIEFKVGS